MHHYGIRQHTSGSRISYTTAFLCAACEPLSLVVICRNDLQNFDLHFTPADVINNFPQEQVTIPNTFDACNKHFKSQNKLKKGMTCDVLSGECAPSCCRLEQLPYLKLVQIRVIRKDMHSLDAEMAQLLEKISRRVAKMKINGLRKQRILFCWQLCSCIY